MVSGRVSWFSPKSKIEKKKDGAVREREGFSIPFIFIHGFFFFTEIGHFYGKKLIGI